MTTLRYKVMAELRQASAPAMAADERGRAAAHEAGHAVAAMALGRRVELHGMAQDGAAGMTYEGGPRGRPLDVATVALAGGIAEVLLTGSLPSGAADIDIEHARRWVGHGVDQAARRAITLVVENWGDIERIAIALIRHGYLEQNDISALVRPR